MTTLQRSTWRNQDNKHYRGHLDRIYVSPTEEWEVEYFIDHYLKTRGFFVSDQNRRIIGHAMEQYQSQAPVSGDALEGFLDMRFRD